MREYICNEEEAMHDKSGVSSEHVEGNTEAYKRRNLEIWLAWLKTWSAFSVAVGVLRYHRPIINT